MVERYRLVRVRVVWVVRVRGSARAGAAWVVVWGSMVPRAKCCGVVCVRGEEQVVGGAVVGGEVGVGVVGRGRWGSARKGVEGSPRLPACPQTQKPVRVCRRRGKVR